MNRKRAAALVRMKMRARVQVQDFGGLHYAADNCKVPEMIKPGANVTTFDFSPALRFLQHDLQPDQRIVFLGEVGGLPAGVPRLNLNTYVVVRMRHDDAANHVSDPRVTVFFPKTVKGPSRR